MDLGNHSSDVLIKMSLVFVLCIMLDVQYVQTQQWSYISFIETFYILLHVFLRTRAHRKRINMMCVKIIFTDQH